MRNSWDIDSHSMIRHKAVGDIIQELYDDLDATLCNIMAAGIPASHFVLTPPQIEFDGNSYNLFCHIGVSENAREMAEAVAPYTGGAMCL